MYINEILYIDIVVKYMVSWSRSFVVALKIFLVTLIWYIIGIVIAILPTIGVLSIISSSLLSGTTPDISTLQSTLLGSGVIVTVAVLIGTFIAVIGAIATSVKFITDEAVEEVRRSGYYGYRPQPTPTPPPY